MTHSELVDCAAAWLRKDHPVVVTEVVTVGESADAIGFRRGFSTMIECKASRGDFLADKNKPWRRNPERALGDFRYYCCPKGMIDIKELPEKWGLLEATGKRLRTVLIAPPYSTKQNLRDELCLLISVLRRIGQNPPKGVSIRCYVYETKNHATVGICPASTIEERASVGVGEQDQAHQSGALTGCASVPGVSAVEAPASNPAQSAIVKPEDTLK